MFLIHNMDNIVKGIVLKKRERTPTTDWYNNILTAIVAGYNINDTLLNIINILSQIDNDQVKALNELFDIGFKCKPIIPLLNIINDRKLPNNQKHQHFLINDVMMLIVSNMSILKQVHFCNTTSKQMHLLSVHWVTI